MARAGIELAGHRTDVGQIDEQVEGDDRAEDEDEADLEDPGADLASGLELLDHAGLAGELRPGVGSDPVEVGGERGPRRCRSARSDAAVTTLSNSSFWAVEVPPPSWSRSSSTLGISTNQLSSLDRCERSLTQSSSLPRMLGHWSASSSALGLDQRGDEEADEDQQPDEPEVGERGAPDPGHAPSGRAVTIGLRMKTMAPASTSGGKTTRNCQPRNSSTASAAADAEQRPRGSSRRGEPIQHVDTVPDRYATLPWARVRPRRRMPVPASCPRWSRRRRPSIVALTVIGWVIGTILSISGSWSSWPSAVAVIWAIASARSDR